MTTRTEQMTSALCSLSSFDRQLLLEFWERQRRGQPVKASLLVELVRPSTPQTVSASFKKFRLLQILRTDRQRKCYWPRHHSPTDFGLQVIAMILGGANVIR